MDKKKKVLVVDDSASYRMLLSRVLGGIDCVEFLGVARDGASALKKVEELKPDYVTVDINMPQRGGFEVLKRLKEEYPEIGVVIISSSDPLAVERTVEALGLGAIDFVVKPTESEGGGTPAELLKGRLEGILSVNFNLLTSAPSYRKEGNKKKVFSSLSQGIGVPSPVDLVLIGVSTGGPNSLERVIGTLPPDLKTPVMIVQHMPSRFLPPLVKRLNGLTPLTVKEGLDGEEVKGGCFYFAPGGRHMTVTGDERGGYLIAIDDGPYINSCRPSVDKLFLSASKVYSAGRLLCVIMTGMGSDGVEGVRALRDGGGGYCISQSEESCVVYGMPRSIEGEGLHCEILHLDDIGGRIGEICN